MRNKSCEKASGSVLPVQFSPRRRAAGAAAVGQPNIDLNPAPNWEKAFRDRTVSPKTSPQTRWISQPGRSSVVTTSTGLGGLTQRFSPRLPSESYFERHVEEAVAWLLRAPALLTSTSAI
jgi:hypothetical protein